MRPVKAVRSIKKNRQFLAKSAGTWYCFSESRLSPADASRGGSATRALAPEKEMDRKWRRKPLESLKTDSEMASRRLTVVKGPAP